MARLFVNVDHVATLRQARLDNYPDPFVVALESLKAGANGITVHLREDCRHIQKSDVDRLRRHLDSPLCLEMGVTDEMLALALDWKPFSVTLVPEKREELTTERGLDLVTYYDQIDQACRQMMASHIQVSLFVDPIFLQIEQALKMGVGVIEIHTGQYASCQDSQKKEEELYRLLRCVEYAVNRGLEVHLGHGLTYDNVSPLVVPQVSCFSIGHSIVSRSIMVGIGQATKEMLLLVRGGGCEG